MKITIETDATGTGGVQSSPTATAIDADQAATGAIDGGAGPADGAGSGSTGSSGDSDGGGPSQALLDAVAAAEAAEPWPGESNGGAGNDGGVGPSA